MPRSLQPIASWLLPLVLLFGLLAASAWGRPAAALNDAGVAPAPGVGQAALPSAGASTTITITGAGFQPQVLTATTGVPVTWFNASGATQRLESGAPDRLYLPLIVRGASFANASGSTTPNRTTAKSSAPVQAAHGELFSTTLAAGATFSYTFAAAGAYPYFLASAPQFVGSINVLLALPPDPAAIAPAFDRSKVTDFRTATAFLYSGTNPIQTGIVSGTIDFQRAAVLRGRVTTAAGAPLSGATIRVLDHPEFGQTLSRTDGRFDLAVNGGAQWTVDFALAGYLPAQRQVQAPWQDYGVLADVNLLPLDPHVTLIDFSSAMQVARGSVISDSAGMRQATLLFPQATTVTLQFDNGMTQTLHSLHVRATEHTAGPSGPAAMPAQLPPGSGYTYAVDFSVDEADALGAARVQFSPAIIAYSENFLHFPVGGIVPAGAYDRERGLWVPDSNGRVIKILSITAGQAELDTDGDNIIDNGVALGVTGAERTQLALLYAAGTTLWRVPIAHFSPWDHNWPFGLPADAQAPLNPPPLKPADDCHDRASGSIIECQNQVLGESAPLAGLPFGLSYSSARTPGRTSAYSLQIPVSGITVPASLLSITLQIRVAGVFTEVLLPANANQSYTFNWDGRDAYGRATQGGQPASVRIGYTYPATYQQPAQFEQSFAAFSGVPIAADPARGQITLWQQYTTPIGVWDARGTGLGGWTLDINHFYDPGARELYRGDGTRQGAQGLVGAGINTIAGGGSCGLNYCGDGGLATLANLFGPTNVALGPDGSLFIADTSNSRVRRISTDGIIHLFAGNNGSNLNDGGPAVNAGLTPRGLAAAPDGSVYIVDTAHQRVRRVAPDGTISTFAGGGGALGDGGPATLAQLSSPTTIALGPDGSLYIVDNGHNRLRRVSPSGNINTVAGTGVAGDTGDGGPASQAQISGPLGVAVGPDGSIYLTQPGQFRVRRIGIDGIIRHFAGQGPGPSNGDGGPARLANFQDPEYVSAGADGSVYISDSATGGRVRRVGPDGIIRTVAGAGGCGSTLSGCGDGGPALGAQLTFALGTAVAPDGALYIAEGGSGAFNRIRRVSALEPGFGTSSVFMPSADGSRAYFFDSGGRHVQTLNALTGASLYSFAYDGAGRLAQVTDGDGLVTTIQRNGAGVPTAVVAPNGQQTTLSVDANGYLNSISDPAGHALSMTYTAGGLLTSLTDPRGHATTMNYDAAGRLLKDQDPLAGFSALARVDSSGGYTVALTSALTHTTLYRVENLPNGDQRHTNTDAAGLQSSTTSRVDSSRIITAPDGTLIQAQAGPDPRWSMFAPNARAVTTTLPSGLRQTIVLTHGAAISDSANIFSLLRLTETVALNGRTSVNIYDAAARTSASTSAAGRQTTAVFDPLGRLMQATIPGILPVTNAFDGRGRLSQVTQGSRTVLFNYDVLDRLNSVTDPLGRSASFGYDPANRVISQTLPGGRTLSFAYDANGNRTALTTPDGTTHTFAYDDNDRLTTYTPPDIGAGATATQYTLNLEGRVTQIIRPDGVTLSASYDGAGRPSTLSQPRGTSRYDYDPASGNVISISAPGGITLALSYDGSLITRTTWLGPVSGTVGAVYDANFRTASLTVNNTQTIAYSYDADGLVTQAGALALARDPQNGRLTGTTAGAVTTTQGYDAFDEVVTYTSSLSGTPFYAVLLGRDALGRIVTRTETISGSTGVLGYTYDAAGRLAQVGLNGTAVQTYTYDANGNRLSFSGPVSGTITGTYDAQDRQQVYGSAVYSYTAYGEWLSKTVSAAQTQYQYDALGNLISATLPGGTQVTYLVDGLNERIGKRVNAIAVQGFLYGGSLQIVAELDGSNNVVSRFEYAGGGNVPALMLKGGATYRLLTDPVGSVRLVVDTTSGALAQRIDYDAFGTIVSDTNPGFQPFGFAGGLYDRDTKLTRFGARDYDAETGRWTAKDPIRFAGGDANLYAYVANDPVNRRDAGGELDADRQWLDEHSPFVDQHREFWKKRKLQESQRTESTSPVDRQWLDEHSPFVDQHREFWEKRKLRVSQRTESTNPKLYWGLIRLGVAPGSISENEGPSVKNDVGLASIDGGILVGDYDDGHQFEMYVKGQHEQSSLDPTAAARNELDDIITSIEQTVGESLAITDCADGNPALRP